MMPFGMGPAGWFLFPYFSQWLTYWWRPFYWGMYPWGYYSPADELEMLKTQQRMLEDQLAQIKRRIADLEKT